MVVRARRISAASATTAQPLPGTAPCGPSVGCTAGAALRDTEYGLWCGRRRHRVRCKPMHRWRPEHGMSDKCHGRVHRRPGICRQRVELRQMAWLNVQLGEITRGHARPHSSAHALMPGGMHRRVAALRRASATKAPLGLAAHAPWQSHLVRRHSSASRLFGGRCRGCVDRPHGWRRWIGDGFQVRGSGPDGCHRGRSALPWIGHPAHTFLRHC